MRIYSMTATFGKLEHETLTLKPGLNIIEAPNEWGKSTWCAFLVAMLYGIETRVHTTKTSLADKERYAPWSGSPMAGRIDLCWNGRDITIERRSKGRSVFGIFHAYETESGLDVPELTAANCGQLLLGVEKEVFLRAGFLQLNDLPVTQNDALRRRLNALVTTGDESGTADALAQKLKDLKNRCRLNRSTGLLPQAAAQHSDVENKLRELQELQTRSVKIRQRQAQLEERHSALLNHRDALAYSANQMHAQKLAAAQAAKDAAVDKVSQLEAVCAQFPAAEETERSLLQLRQLRQYWESVHMETKLLPQIPQKPEIPDPFRELSEENATAQAAQDAAQFREAETAQAKRLPGIWGLILAIVSLAFLLIPHWSGYCATAVGMVVGLLCWFSNSAMRHRAAKTADTLTSKYKPLPPEEWEHAAHIYVQQQRDYAANLESYQLERANLERRTDELNEKIAVLTQGKTLAECEQYWVNAQTQRRALEDATRELHRTEDYVHMLRTSVKEVLPPQFADTLNYSEQETARLLSDCAYEQRQLQLQLGHCQGRMEMLGTEAELQQQLDNIQTRIAQLEDTYAALEIAQNTLAAATTELQRRFAPRISKRAQELFGKLTGGRYSRLTLGEDFSVQAAAAEEETLHSSMWRSEGTVDQLYLALRLAVAEELTPQAPLILDDALVRFDGQRLTQAVALLEESAACKQVILFTCQDRENRALGK